VIKFFQISVTSLILSALVAAPAVYVVTADTAIAKSENAGGKGKGGGNRGNGGGKGKGNDGGKGNGKGNDGGKGNGNGGGKGKSDNAGKGKGKDNSLSNGRAFGKNAFDKSTTGKGKSKTKNRQNSAFASAGQSLKKSLKSFGDQIRSDLGLKKAKKSGNKVIGSKKAKTRRAVEVSLRPPNRSKKGFDHPSNLGKMNGAVNSSEQAKLAHMKNGNFNGPVGVAAYYALEDYNYYAAEKEYEIAQSVIEKFGDLAKAYELIEGVEDGSIAATPEAIQEARELIEEAEDKAIEKAQEANPGEEIDEDAVREALEEGVTELVEEAEMVEEPDRTALEDAEDALFDLYKGDEDSLTDEQKDQIIESMRLPSYDQIEDVVDHEDENDMDDDDVTIQPI